MPLTKFRQATEKSACVERLRRLVGRDHPRKGGDARDRSEHRAQQAKMIARVLPGAAGKQIPRARARARRCGCASFRAASMAAHCRRTRHKRAAVRRSRPLRTAFHRVCALSLSALQGAQDSLFPRACASASSARAGLQIAGERLFRIDMLAGVERGAGHLEMAGDARGDRPPARFRAARAGPRSRDRSAGRKTAPPGAAAPGSGRRCRRFPDRGNAAPSPCNGRTHSRSR